jgi:uncharacterized membrane protein
MPSGRIVAFDWLRGVAVVVMIQTHALVLLRPELERTRLFTWIVRVDGLVAPSFLFSAGFALALVQVRAALSTGPLKWVQASKPLRRIGEVLFVASLINRIWFPTWREPKWLLRIDILHCVGLTLLGALPLLVFLAHRPFVLRWLMLGMALVVFGSAPLAENVTGFWSLFANSRVGFIDDALGTTFPLLPWSGYVFLGASFGATVGAMRKEATLWRWWGLLAAIGATLWFFDAFFERIYPPHHFWVTNPANAAQRWTLVLAFVAMLRAVEVRWPNARTLFPAQRLAAFGAASLSAYFFHQMLLSQRHVGFFGKVFRGTCTWVTFWPVLAGLIIATYLCVKWWDRIDPLLRARLAQRTRRTPSPHEAQNGHRSLR